MRHLRLALAAALALAAGALAPGTATALGPLPECRRAEIQTVPNGYDDWAVTLVDRLLTVGPSYVPPDLTLLSKAGVAGGGYVRAVAIDDLREMAAAAKKAGNPIASWSPYRGYKQQVALFNGYVRAYGEDRTIWFSQPPGHSEHQLGLAIDFMSAGGGSPMKGDWATTPAGAWMKKHAWEYGWLMSYPSRDLRDVICFNYEPWHYRYVGRELAAKIHASGLTIREYLWTNYTMVDPVTGSPLPSETPSPPPTPSPTPSAASTPSPVASPPGTAAPAPAPDDGIGVAAISAGAILLVLAAAVVAWVALRGSTRHRD